MSLHARITIALMLLVGTAAAGGTARRVSTANSAPAPAVAVELGQYSIAKDATALRVMGYVANTGHTPAMQLRVSVSLLGADGGVLVVHQAGALRTMLPVGQRSPFLAVFSPVPGGWASERVEIQAQPYSPGAPLARQRAGGLATQHEVYTVAKGDGAPFTVSGQVRNGGQTPAAGVRVIGIAYDAQGSTLDVNESPVQTRQIGPGHAAAFTVALNSRGQPLGRYGLYVEGTAR